MIGKSTTLRMVAGLEEISEGEISIGNTVVNNMPPKDRDIAMVFQNYALYPHMNVYNNMAFSLKLVSENGGIYFEEGYGRIRMPEHYRAALSHHINGKVELGIRPEKIKDLPPSSEERTQDTLKAKVEVVEHLGAEMMLYLRSPSNAFLAKVDAHHTAHVDQEMHFTVDSERLHVFDVETGQNLTVSAARHHLEKR